MSVSSLQQSNDSFLPIEACHKYNSVSLCSVVQEARLRVVFFSPLVSRLVFLSGESYPAS